MNPTKRIVFLDWLRVIACLMVMTVHASESIYSNDYSFSFPTEGARWSVCLINGLMRPAVPLFLIASAYLLAPLNKPTGVFFRKRMTRVVIPFLLWLGIYATLPVLWGEFSADQALCNLTQVYINFIPSASHLWFIYMLLGIYLIMPVISPWLRQVSRREEEGYLLVWLFTTLFWLLHEKVGDVFGECWWNPFPLFYYVSGYVGYVILAHYIKTYIDWSLKKTLAIALPLFLVGYGICVWSFYTRSFEVEEVRLLELQWQTTSICPVLMSIGAFLTIKKINCKKDKVNAVVRRNSAMTYGMYLMHMLILPHIFKTLDPQFPTPVIILGTAVTTYIICYIITQLLSIVPGGKYLVG